MRCLCVFGENFPKVRPYEGHILAVSAMDLLEALCPVDGQAINHWINLLPGTRGPPKIISVLCFLQQGVFQL